MLIIKNLAEHVWANTKWNSSFDQDATNLPLKVFHYLKDQQTEQTNHLSLKDGTINQA